MDCIDKIGLNKVTHSVRASQAILQYGVGAMIDFPEQTLMTAAPELWESGVTKIHDVRLEKLLGVDYFGMPGEDSKGISYARFPEWYFCPRCRKFQPLKSWIKEYSYSSRNKRRVEKDPYMVHSLKCPTCFQDLVVARIIIACGHGHIDDFPWIKWVHAKNFYGPKAICDNPKLEFKTSASSSEGLEGITINCKTCGAKATLKGAFDKDAFKKLDEKTDYKYDFSCTGRHPWKNKREKCNEYPHVLQRGGSSVYFPIIFSSLVIPPYSSKITSEIQESKTYSELRLVIKDNLNTLDTLPGISQDQKELIIKNKINEYIPKISNDIGKPKAQVKTVLLKIFKPQRDEVTISSIDFKAEEYSALSGELTATDNTGDFIREEVNIGEYNIPGLKSISLINKVREVQALIGFSRLEPIDEDNISEDNTGIKSVSVKEDSTNWYPGYEVRGEGIFVEFREDAILQWIYNTPVVQERINHINDSYHHSYFGRKKPRKITAKFLLLHTISHLLMKQLSFECGYSIASLKERIYSSEVADGKAMSGIFIYTASGDSEGTLGGLVRQGYPDTFPKIFRNAIEGAKTCSNDPVCSLSMGQGRESLNLAACYSCTLVPETSCEEYNMFLDRGVVIGTIEDPSIGFYSNEMDTKKKKNMSEKKIENIYTPKPVLTITDKGINLQNAEFYEVWSSMQQFAVSETEKNAIKIICEHESDFMNLEKPYKGASFSFDLIKNYDVDLVWMDAKVLLFSGENEEEYVQSQKSDWNSFSLSNENFSYNEFIRVLRGE